MPSLILVQPPLLPWRRRPGGTATRRRRCTGHLEAVFDQEYFYRRCEERGDRILILSSVASATATSLSPVLHEDGRQLSQARDSCPLLDEEE
jgi:hypothetical protein